MTKPLTILVTGGAGFIGSSYVRLLRREYPHWRVIVLDLFTYAGNRATLADLESEITVITGDIADPAIVYPLMAEVDIVVNFAAESHVDRSLRDPRPFVHTNLEGTLVLLEAARQQSIQRFVHVSTDEVYGDLVGTERHSHEGDPLLPRSPYAATKAGAEHLVFSYGISYSLDVVITRGSNTYGPYQYPEKIIPLFITNALEGKPLPLYGRGEAVRDYLHVEDHCRGIHQVLQHGVAGRAYNLGAREQINGCTVAQTILGLLDRPLDQIAYVTDRPGHDYRYSVDPSPAEYLGWQRHWTFLTGMADTVAWYQSHPEWWQALKARSSYRDHYQQWYERRSS